MKHTPIIICSFAVLILVTSCSYDKNLIGNWAIMEMYSRHEVIFGNKWNYGVGPTMTIKGKHVFIDFHGYRTNLEGRLTYMKSKGKTLIEFSEFSDQVLNSIYEMKLDLIIGTKTSKYKKIEMILESDSVFIKAIKSETSLI